MRRLIAGLAGSVIAATAVVGAAPAQAAPLGERPLAAVLGVNPGSAPKFDHNWNDYDILRSAVNAILAAKPGSPVGALAQGNVAATCFIPSDRAFRIFVQRAFPNAHGYPTEKSVFTTLATKIPGGLSTLETVVLYHCTAGTIDSSTALKANGAKLGMLAGGRVTVSVKHGHIGLLDRARAYADPWVTTVDINKGNKQIAHGINRVLLPLPLPAPLA